MNFLGGKSQVRHYPKGVVGIISPWNLPFGLTVAPLTSALAAGNRAILKPSEFVPETAALFAEVMPRYFSEEEVAVVTGGAAVSQQFGELPFDHLLFTGSTRIGAKVMQSASKNLVPVTLMMQWRRALSLRLSVLTRPEPLKTTVACHCTFCRM